MRTTLLDIVVPIRCAGCGKHGTCLCVSCRMQIALQPLAHRRAGNGKPRVIALGRHSGMLRQAIISLKFRQRRTVAQLLATMLARKLSCDCNAIVPVPLHWQRLRERGFNQAQLIATALATTTGIPCYGAALLRVRATRPQTSLAIGQRRSNVCGAFQVPAHTARALQDKRVMLVDDVVTSGNTIAACAAALKNADVSDVVAVALALAP